MGMARTPSFAAVLIGSRIAERRAALNLKVDQLAVRAGADSSNIRGYEFGRATMNLRTLVRIAEALRVAPGKLISGVTSEMFEPGE